MICRGNDRLPYRVAQPGETDVYKMMATRSPGIDVTVRLRPARIKDEPFVPVVPEWTVRNASRFFDAIRERDRLVHHPYDSYDCVTDSLTSCS
jgi:polyphosphate kinase